MQSYFQVWPAAKIALWMTLNYIEHSVGKMVLQPTGRLLYAQSNIHTSVGKVSPKQ